MSALVGLAKTALNVACCVLFKIEATWPSGSWHIGIMIAHTDIAPQTQIRIHKGS